MSEDYTFSSTALTLSWDYNNSELPIGAIVALSNVKIHNGVPVRWTKVVAPTVGRAWKAPVYLCTDGTEIIDFNNQIEIAWDEEV